MPGSDKVPIPSSREAATTVQNSLPSICYFGLPWVEEPLEQSDNTCQQEAAGSSRMGIPTQYLPLLAGGGSGAFIQHSWLTLPSQITGLRGSFPELVFQ